MAFPPTNNDAIQGNMVMELKRVGNLLEELIAVERDTQARVSDTFFLLEKKLDALIAKTSS